MRLMFLFLALLLLFKLLPGYCMSHRLSFNFPGFAELRVCLAILWSVELLEVHLIDKMKSKVKIKASPILNLRSCHTRVQTNNLAK